MNAGLALMFGFDLFKILYWFRIQCACMQTSSMQPDLGQGFNQYSILWSPYSIPKEVCAKPDPMVACSYDALIRGI